MTSPSSRPRKTYQERIFESIISGDLESFTAIPFAKGEINRLLLQPTSLAYRPRYNPSEQYIRPHVVTPLILSILCEQIEIVEFILTNRDPDLSVRVAGYTALHIAAMIKDHRPLQLLIRHQWIQENINLPIKLQGILPQEGNFTTAVHAAISNRRLSNLFLLLSPFPAYKKLPGDDQETIQYQTATPDQRSAVGSPPLHIAISLRDKKAVEVLLAAGADPKATNAAGESAIQFAERLKNGTRERPGIRPISDPSGEICQLLENPPGTPLDVLKEKYAPELLEEQKAIVRTANEEEEEEEAAEGKSKVPEVVSAQKEEEGERPRGGGGRLQRILDEVEELAARVGQLEEAGTGNIPKEEIKEGE